MKHEKLLGQFNTHMPKPAVSENEDRVVVLGERVRNGNREIRAHWDGYDQSADEWIDARQLHEEN